MRNSTVSVAVLTLAVSSLYGFAADGPHRADPPAFPTTRSVVPQGKPTEAHDALHMMIPTLNVDNASFGQVIDQLREITNANIVVHWRVLEAAGLSREAPVTLNVNNVRIHKILDLIFDQVSPGVSLVCSASDNVIEITTQEEADKTLVTRVYAIDDLVMSDNRNLQPPVMNLSALTQSSSGGNTASGSLFTDNGNTNNQNVETAQQKGEAIAALVKDTVRPNIWRDNGGNSSVKYLAGKLIITAPLSVQEAIGGSSLPEGGRRFGF